MYPVATKHYCWNVINPAGSLLSWTEVGDLLHALRRVGPPPLTEPWESGLPPSLQGGVEDNKLRQKVGLVFYCSGLTRSSIPSIRVRSHTQ